jgi:hypothetical protein
LLGFKAKNKNFPQKPLPMIYFYAAARQQSSDDVHTFEDRVREKHSRTNIVGEDNRSRLQGCVVVQVDKDECYKCSTSEGFHMYDAAKQRKKKDSDRKSSSATAFGT